MVKRLSTRLVETGVTDDHFSHKNCCTSQKDIEGGGEKVEVSTLQHVSNELISTGAVPK